MDEPALDEMVDGLHSIVDDPVADVDVEGLRLTAERG